MAYHIDLPLILVWQYPQADASSDWLIDPDGEGWAITYWNVAKLGVQPSEQDILDLVLPYWQSQCRIKGREWAAQINSRAFQDNLPGAIDDIITQHTRQAVREMFNAGIAEFATANSLSATTISGAESKAAFETREPFQLILLAGEARSEMKAISNALTDGAEAKAFAQNLGDEVAAQAWSDANGGTGAWDGGTGNPTLGNLLIAYPADYE